MALLLDPGPVRLFTEAEFPVVQWRPTLDGLVAPAVAELGAAEAALSVAQSTLASAGGSGLDGDAALDLGAAAAADANQSSGPSADLGAVAAGTEGLGEELAGLIGEAESELNNAIPSWPRIPPGTEAATQLPVSQWDQAIVSTFIDYVGRAPTLDELEQFRVYYPRFDDAYAYLIANWPERDRTGTPPPPPPPPAGGGDQGGGGGGSTLDACALLAAYAAEFPSWAGQIDRFLSNNPGDCGRAPSALGLPGWDAFVARH